MSHNTNLHETFIIDSKDRESNSTSSTDFIIKVPKPSQEVREYHIRKVIIPLVMDNITASNNTYEIDGTPASIDVGHYNITTLMALMTANHFGVYTFTFGANGRVTISSDAPANFQWEPLECMKLLGFTQAVYTLADSYTAENFPHLFPTKYFTLHSEAIMRMSHKHFSHSDNRPNMISFIPMVTDISELLVFVPSDPLVIYVDGVNSDEFDIQLRDDSNVIVDIQGHSMVLMIERRK